MGAHGTALPSRLSHRTPSFRSGKHQPSGRGTADPVRLSSCNSDGDHLCVLCLLCAGSDAVDGGPTPLVRPRPSIQSKSQSPGARSVPAASPKRRTTPRFHDYEPWSLFGLMGAFIVATACFLPAQPSVPLSPPPPLSPHRGALDRRADAPSVPPPAALW